MAVGPGSGMDRDDVAAAREVLLGGVGRRDFLSAAAATAGTGALLGAAAPAAEASTTTRPPAPRRPARAVGPVLQPGKGRIDGDTYLPSRVEQVRWGYVPSVSAEP